MANHLYGYNPSSYGTGASSFPSLYSPRSGADAYNPSDSSLYGAASRFIGANPERASSMFSQSDILRYGGADIAGTYPAGLSGRVSAGGVSQSSWLGVDGGGHDPLGAGFKRPPDSLYHQTLLGTHNMIGQSEAWYSSNPLAKRPRFESGSNLPVYPQRPGEKDCAHYMLTRTCKFADTCKFDHPIWVPEGGIPDWKEVPPVPPTETLPERPGEPDCPYFLKTQKCKFGFKCKFNHPKEKMVTAEVQEGTVFSALPERPSEPPCAFYLKAGKCKFGTTCKFHHPKDIELPFAGQDNATDGQSESAPGTDGTTGLMQQSKPNFAPASLHNSKGLPIRPGEVECPFYLKTGSCKYGATCRYSHPDRYGINQPANAVVPSLFPSPAAHLTLGFGNPAASMLQTIDPRLAQTTLGLAATMYPQRPGQIECDYYMKTGKCLFAERCKYHHPIDRSASTLATDDSQQQNVKLSLAGLPRREGATHCPYYMKTGTCKYGATCKFDHPPPAEVLAMATAAAAAAAEGEGKVETEVQEQQQQQ